MIETKFNLSPWMVRYLRETARARNTTMSNLIRNLILQSKLNADQESREETNDADSNI